MKMMMMTSVQKHTDLNATQKTLLRPRMPQTSTHSSGCFALFPKDNEAGRSMIGVKELLDPGQSRRGTFSRRKAAPKPEILGSVFA